MSQIMDFITAQEKQVNIQKCVSHIQNRQKIKKVLQDQGIQMLNKEQQILQSMSVVQLNADQSNQFETMKKELKDKGYSDFRYLGSGVTGFVLLAKKQKTNQRFAIKGVHTRDSNGKVYQEAQQQVEQEIMLLKNCVGSPYVVNLIEHFQGKEYTYLVINECQGTLYEIVQMQPSQKLNEISAIKYAKDIAEGLCFVHDKNCILNDLKMDNILIDYNGNAVVSDFGFADFLTKASGYGLNDYMGNFLFQAPECYDSNKFSIYSDAYKSQGIITSTKPSTKSEACSLGYLIYIMIQGYNNNFILNKHEPLNFNSEFDNFKYKNLLRNLITGLTQFNPKSRLSVRDAFLTLTGIITLDFKQNNLNFVEYLEQSTQKFLQHYLKNEVEFVQAYSNYYYPIFKNEQEAKDKIQQLDSLQNLSQQGTSDALIASDKVVNVTKPNNFVSIPFLSLNLFYIMGCCIDIALGFYGLQAFSVVAIILKCSLVSGLINTFKVHDNLSPGKEHKHFRYTLNIFLAILSIVQVISFGFWIAVTKNEDLKVGTGILAIISIITLCIYALIFFLSKPDFGQIKKYLQLPIYLVNMFLIEIIVSFSEEIYNALGTWKILSFFISIGYNLFVYLIYSDQVKIYLPLNLLLSFIRFVLGVVLLDQNDMDMLNGIGTVSIIEICFQSMFQTTFLVPEITPFCFLSNIRAMITQLLKQE